MSTHFDYVIYVDIDHHSLGRQILTCVFGSTLRIVLYVDINDVVKMCRHRVRWSMSTLRSKPFSVDIQRNLRVDLLNFDLNNSTHTYSVTNFFNGTLRLNIVRQNINPCKQTTTDIGCVFDQTKQNVFLNQKKNVILLQHFFGTVAHSNKNAL